jgi:hypothetical protein
MYIFLKNIFSSYVSDLSSKFYFQLGSCFSIYGCLFKDNEFGGRTANDGSLDGVLDIPELPKSPDQEFHTREVAGVWGYVFQIIYQVI